VVGSHDYVGISDSHDIPGYRGTAVVSNEAPAPASNGWYRTWFRRLFHVALLGVTAILEIGVGVGFIASGKAWGELLGASLIALGVGFALVHLRRSEGMDIAIPCLSGPRPSLFRLARDRFLILCQHLNARAAGERAKQMDAERREQ